MSELTKKQAETLKEMVGGDAVAIPLRTMASLRDMGLLVQTAGKANRGYTFATITAAGRKMAESLPA